LFDEKQVGAQTMPSSVIRGSNEWGCTTGNAAPVATATFYVLKENKAENIS
jgi:hypothetical protein